MTAAPRIARVHIKFSENGTVPRRAFPSLAAADAALAVAFAKEPPPEGGAYDKTDFEVVWTDGWRHAGRLDVTRAMFDARALTGGMLRGHLAQMARWYSNPKSAPWLEGRKAVDKIEHGAELERRLQVDYPLGSSRNARSYAGRGVPELRGPRSRATLPAPDAATFWPDPRAAFEAVVSSFRALRGANRDGSRFPELVTRDIRSFANLITFALRNDLPAIDPGDAAVIWEKWRQAIQEIRNHLRNVRDDDATGAASDGVWGASIVLEHRGSDIADSLATARARPREVFERYCPWRSDWATFERLHPEAV